MGFGSGGGSASIASSSDVALNNPLNNNVLTYDTSTSKWKNGVVPTIIPSDYGIIPAIYWTGSAWPARTLPSGYTGAVTWDSATDQAATAPPNSVAGDRWLRRVA